MNKIIKICPHCSGSIDGEYCSACGCKILESECIITTPINKPKVKSEEFLPLYKINGREIYFTAPREIEPLIPSHEYFTIEKEFSNRHLKEPISFRKVSVSDAITDVCPYRIKQIIGF